MKPLTGVVLLVVGVVVVGASCQVGVGGGCLENPDDPRCRDGGGIDGRADGDPGDGEPGDRAIDGRDLPEVRDDGARDGEDGVTDGRLDTESCVPRTVCESGECGMVDDGCEGLLDCALTACRADQEMCSATNVCGCATGKDECGTGTCRDLQTDPLHCGRCGHDCLGGTCAGGKCQRIELATGQAAPTAIAVEGRDVYWVNYDPNGAVMTVAIDKDNQPGTARAVATGQFNPRAIAVDATEVFWVNESTGTNGEVRRATRIGFTLATVATGENRPSGIAIDASDIYWVNRVGGTVRNKAKTDPPATLPSSVASTQASPIDVAVSGANVLWVNAGVGAGDGTVMRLGRGSLALSQMVPAALTADGSAVYWVNQGGGTVLSVPIAGGTPTPLASSQSSPIDVVQDETHVYWVNHVAAGGLYRVPKTGGPTTPEPIAEGLDYPRGLFVDVNSVYFVTDANAASQTGAVYRIAKP